MLGRVLAFLGTPGEPEQIAEAVAYASYDNMKRLEQDKVFWLSGTRLAAGDPANPQSYKVRRAKVGGWRDDFTAEQVAAIDALLAARPRAALRLRRRARGVAARRERRLSAGGSAGAAPANSTATGRGARVAARPVTDGL